MGFVSKGYDVDLPKWADNALLLDTVRGFHSTGAVFAKDGEAQYYKRAVAGYDFIHLPTYKKIRDAYASFFIGHNRAATMGAVNDVNAHPFSFGDWVGVHNGSLHHGWKGYLGNEYDVDSEAIIAAVAEEGLKRTLEQLRGAYSLVLYNAKEDRLYFARNTERPMNLVFSANKRQMFFGSELELVKAAMLRNRFGVGSVQETEVGMIYSIGKDLVLKEEEKFEVKKQVVSYQGTANRSAQGSTSGASSLPATRSASGYSNFGSWPDGKRPYEPKTQIYCYFTERAPYGNFKDRFKVVGFTDDKEFTPVVLNDIPDKMAQAILKRSEGLKIEVTYGTTVYEKEPAIIGKVADYKDLEKKEDDQECAICQGHVADPDLFTVQGKPVCEACCIQNGWAV